jgi:hypothetical protein
LLAGLEVQHANLKPATDVTMRVVKAMLRRGFILLPEGEDGNVIGFTPPLTITKPQLREAVRELPSCVEESRMNLSEMRRIWSVQYSGPTLRTEPFPESFFHETRFHGRRGAPTLPAAAYLQRPSRNSARG